MLDHVSAVIFDLDGTLVDSMWMWRDIDIEYLARFGIDMPENLQEEISGISVTQTAHYFKNTFRLEDSIEQIISDWDDMAVAKYQYEVPLKEGVMAFLDALQARGIVCAIATSNSRTLTDTVLAAHGIEDYFTEVITGEDVHQGKPDPDIYLVCAERLGIDPSACLVFEDIPKGIEAAQAAGMKVCAVEDDYSIGDTYIKRKMADYYIRSYEDILSGSYENEWWE